MKKPISLVLAVSVFASSCAQNPPVVAQPEAARVPTSAAEDPWTTWSRDQGMVGGLLVLSRIRDGLLKNNLHDPHVDYAAYTPINCAETNSKYRSADGTCNNMQKPHVGAAGVAFGRNVPPQFIDKEADEKLMEPNPAEVSKVLFTRDEFKPVPFLNMLAASWIQFMNHDWLTHGKNAEANPYRVQTNSGEEQQVERTSENPVSENHYKREFSKVTLNGVTHWWDGSQLYGSNQAEQDHLRSKSRGKMRTVVTAEGREILPRNDSFNPAMNKQNQGLEETGFRDNWWVGLSMLHHLFVKEHNAIADKLFTKYVRGKNERGMWVWSEKNRILRNDRDTKLFTDEQLDEHIFQLARLVNAAVMAKIHTIEWTPAILPNKTLRKGMYSNWYGLANPQTWSSLLRNIPGFNRTDWFSGTNLGYVVGGIVGDKTNDYGVPFSITEEFTSVYRLHSLLPEEINLRRLSKKDEVKAVKFDETRNEKSYDLVSGYDMKDLFYSFGKQHPGQLVLNNFPKFMQELTIPGMGKMDLAMVDIIRDRERGVPRYNQFRRAINLKPITEFRDFFPADKPLDERQTKIIEKLRQVYGVTDGKDNVEAIDLLVGTSAEEVRPENFGFGETMFQIFILMASRRLMADRFFTSDYKKEVYTAEGLRWIDDEGFMHKVILRHMPELRDNLKGLETAFSPWKN